MSANSNNGNNNIVVPKAKQALNQNKAEIASELGMTNNQDKGNLTSRQNGYAGGNMTKSLGELSEQVLKSLYKGQIK